MGTEKTIKLRIVETSDVHGCFIPYDFVERKPLRGTMAMVNTYVKRLRSEYGDNLILLENGDILQGQPSCYWSNVLTAEIKRNRFLYREQIVAIELMTKSL